MHTTMQAADHDTDHADTLVPPEPPVRLRTAEETEALIARLHRNLDERMHGREGTTDAARTLRLLRAKRSRALRRR